MIFEHLILRGDRFCYAQVDGRFPYVDLAARIGASGLHIWFWAEPYRAVKDEFLAYCRSRNLTVHLGVGVGAYGVCDGENPLDASVQQRIADHVVRTIEEQDIDGIEFQTGEYDNIEFKGDAASGLPYARKLIDALNPMIDLACKQKPSLWIRTELHADHYNGGSVAEVSRDLDPRCTVEWSHHMGPLQGEGAFEAGR